MATSGWTPTKLGDLVEIKHGWPFKSEHFHEDLTGLPVVVSVGNFRYTGGFRFAETSVKEYRDNYPKEYELAPGNILLIMTCQTAGGEILGVPARVPDDGRMYLHNQRLGKVVIREGANVEPKFLYWLFLWQEFNRELVTSASGTKILHTAPSRIEAFHFDLPPKDEQRAIAHILGTLDDKIELNRQMNETLEAMARALFKSWFVDFDPVRAKSRAECRGTLQRAPTKTEVHLADLFPDSFEDSDLGEIPKGWNVYQLSNFGTIKTGKTPSTQVLGNFGNAVMFVTPSDMDGRRYIFHTKRYLSDQGANSVSSAKVPSGALIVSCIGSDMGKTVIAGRECVANQQINSLIPDEDSWREYIYYNLSTRKDELQILAGSGSTLPILNKSDFSKLEMLRPPQSLLESFHKIAKPMGDKIAATYLETQTLTSIRDTLLPKLLSGEMRVRDAERFLGRHV